MPDPEMVTVAPSTTPSSQFQVYIYGDPATVEAGWTRSRDIEGNAMWYRRSTYNGQAVAASYLPPLTAPGKYRLQVFVPDNHATIRDAMYFVVDHKTAVRREIKCVVNQNIYRNQWVELSGTEGPGQPLVNVFELDPVFDDSGRVNLVDTTFINELNRPKGFEIAFGAIRWVPVSTPDPIHDEGDMAGVFDAPVGTEAARRNSVLGAPGNVIYIGGQPFPIWLDEWFDYNTLGSRYLLRKGVYAIHTGADLNRMGGALADKDQPVYACADGVVRYSGSLSSGWKGVVLIEHEVPGEAPVYIRYGHLYSLRFQNGARVKRGEIIGLITEYAPYNYHLHFDITRNPAIVSNVGHWPGDNYNAVMSFYIDPLEFLRAHHR